MPSASTTAVRNHAVLGDRRPAPVARLLDARIRRDPAAPPEGGVLHHAVGGTGKRPPGVRGSRGGDRAFASRSGGGRHRDRRRDARHRGGRVGSHRRVSDQGLAGAGGRWPSLLSPTRGPGEPQTHRVPYPQFESGLPPLPRGPLADSSRRAQEGTRQPRQTDPQVLTIAQFPFGTRSTTRTENGTKSRNGSQPHSSTHRDTSSSALRASFSGVRI